MKIIPTLLLLTGLVFSSVGQAGAREETAWKLVEEGALLVDVRTQQEYMGGHLDEAVLIPHTQVVDEFNRRGIPKDQPVVVYCRSGNRSGMAEAALRRAGYTQIFNGGAYRSLMSATP